MNTNVKNLNPVYSCLYVIPNIKVYDWWLVSLRIYVALAILQPYRDLEEADNQSLKS